MGKDPWEMGLQSDDNYMPTKGAFCAHWLLCCGEGVWLGWDYRADSFSVVLTELMEIAPKTANAY